MSSRKIKKHFGKKQCLLALKILVFMIAFCAYCVIIVKESVNITNNKSKSKTVAKFNSNEKQSEQYQTPAPLKEDSTQKIVNKNSKLNSTDHGGASTVNYIYEYSEEINAQAEKDFEERRLHLGRMCNKYKMVGNLTPNAWEFFISTGHGIVWCNVFKAASTKWMYFMNILAGYDIKYLHRTSVSPLELARKRFPRPSLDDLNEALPDSISFLIVREPFERLLSAYRNKMEEGKNTYYRLLGDEIVKRFRSSESSQKSDSSGPTFKEFLQFIVQHYKTSGRFDEHWSPIYKFCTPCSINFTLIAKMETLERDTEYIVRQAGLESLLLNKLPKAKKTKISNSSRNKTSSLIPKYYAQIKEDLLRQLLEIYQLDFDLFNYDSSKYMKIVQKTLKG